MTIRVAYDIGTADACAAFGVRCAELVTHQRMPDGPHHLGAERLSRLLQSNHDLFQSAPEPSARRNNLDRTPNWGDPVSLESSSTSARGTGPLMMGLNGGV